MEAVNARSEARLAQAPDIETHVVAELDINKLERVRTDLPSLANRRPEVYG